MDDFTGLLATATKAEIEVMTKELRQVFPFFQGFTDQETVSSLIRRSFPTEVVICDAVPSSPLGKAAVYHVLNVAKIQHFVPGGMQTAQWTGSANVQLVHRLNPIVIRNKADG